MISYDLQEIQERAFFCEMITYISEYIEGLRTESDMRCVYIECAPQHEQEVLEKLGQLKEMVTKQMTGKETQLAVKTLEDYTDREPICRDDVFQQLLDMGAIYTLSDASYAYSDIFLRVYHYFDRKIEAFGYETFGALGIEEHTVPVLYSVAGYDAGGYFETFPHHIMFESVLKNDISVLNSFSEKGTEDGEIFREMKLPDNVLRTAACAPLYPYMQDKTVESGTTKVFLVSGRCFRNEGNNVRKLARLKEFYMKEYVFIGAAEKMTEHIQTAHALWNEWISVFGLNAKIETANDSFFANNYKKLKLFQLLGQSKQEFKLLIPSDDDYISCSSANFHRTHFTKRYRIYDGSKEKLANSACFAFGVDRLTYALLSQKGLDPAKWDAQTREEIEKYVKL